MKDEKNQVLLSEPESKRLLAEYGVPVVEEVVAATAEEAVGQAARLGYPVVLKGVGAQLTHKTERGLVKLSLSGPQAVRTAAREIEEGAGHELEGYLVQPMLEGRREFVAGLFRDPVFGPVVMFGLGGVLTEALDDVAFRLAPLDEADAGQMMGEIRSARLLEEFRGGAAADRGAVVSTLLGLSRLAVERPDVAEVDVNPLLATESGEVLGVDALVVLEEPRSAGPARPRIAPTDLAALFYPKSVAFIGASAAIGKWGQTLPANLVAGDFQGRISLVNPKGGTIAGRPVYSTVGDVPDAVDLAVITVPAPRVPGLIPQLRAKGVRHGILITSGFAETGEEGRALEEQVTAMARDAGIILLGPNTMGISNPPANLHLTGVHTRPKAGSTALISQSGNMGVQLLAFAERQGLGIRAFGGSGNEAMVGIEDFMEAFEHDGLTRTVVLYVESVKDGRRFFESAQRVGRKKPVIVLKGGRTEAGGRAAASHTGAMSSDFRVFDAACRQAGIVVVSQPMDMLDASAAFSSLPLPPGRRVAIMTLGGGWGVVTSDLCAEYGLEVPELDSEVTEHLDRLLPPYWSRANPVDLVGERDPELPMTALEALLRWDGCDAVINLGILGRKHFLDQLLASTAAVDPTHSPGQLQELRAAAEAFESRYVSHIVRLMERHGKPVLGVSLVSGSSDRTLYDADGSQYKGVFFHTPERAVKALAEMCNYRDFLSRTC